LVTKQAAIDVIDIYNKETQVVFKENKVIQLSKDKLLTERQQVIKNIKVR
jgi:hypothetical protein